MDFLNKEPAQQAPRKQKGTIRRFIGIVVWLIVLGAIGGGVYVLANAQSKKRTDAYRKALDEVQKSTHAQELLGDPIVDASWVPTGKADVDGDRGDADFYFRVSGPKGAGAVATKLRMVDGKWGLLDLTLIPDATGTRLDVMQDVKPADDGAPAFVPSKPADKQPKTQPPEPPKEIKIELPKIPDGN